MDDVFYLIRFLGGENFEVVDTVIGRAAADAYNLQQHADGRELHWHNSFELFGPATHKHVGGFNFQPIKTVREPEASDVLRLLIRKGLITRADIEAVDPAIADRVDLKK